MTDSPGVVVGIARRSHGVRGEIVVESRSDNPNRWKPGAVVRCSDGRRLRVERVRSHGEMLLVVFDGIANRDAAAGVRGELTVPEAELPELSDGSFWPHEILGFDVRTVSGRSLGSLVEVLPGVAQDLWVARDDEGNERMIPASRELVLHVDRGQRRVEVVDLPGLTAPDHEDSEPRDPE